jgi:hypothetical protein
MEVDHMAKKNPYLNDRDILDQALEHSWGKTADAKAKEKAYNREYYQRHKEEILRKARQAGEGIQRTAQNAVNDVRTATYLGRRPGEHAPSYQDIDRYRNAHAMNAHLSNEARERYNTASNDAVETARTARNYHQGRGHNPTYNKAYDEYLGRTANDVMDASNRAYKNQRRMANRRASSEAALNEAQKAHRAYTNGAYDIKYDSKLARDAQNAYSKLRNPKEMARRAGESAKKAYDNVKTAFSKDRRGSSSVDSAKTNKTSEMNSRLRNEGRARYNEAARNADELSRYERNYRQGRAHNPTYTREYNNYIGREANRAIDESNRAYKNASRMAKRASSSGAAANEASKASQQQGYEKRFDSKLARDAQIAYSKARGTARKAKDAVDRYVDDTLDYAKKLNKDARTGINDAYNRAKSGIEDVYSQASRKTKNVKNDLETSKRLRQMKNADALLKAINRLPSDKYEETQELTRKLRTANAQAYKQASKAKKKKKS